MGYIMTKSGEKLLKLLPHIEEYVKKLITPHSDDEIDHFKKGATVIHELSNRVEKALEMENILDISSRKEYLKQFIEDTTLFPIQKTELYEKIIKSGIINY